MGKKALSAKKFAEAAAGIIEAGFLMAAADGNITQEEVDTLVGTMVGLFSDIDEDEVGEILEACYSALQEEGWSARLAAVGENLSGRKKDDAAETAMYIAALVLMADGAVTRGEEDVCYYALADAMSFDRESAESIFDSAYADMGYE